MWSMHKNVAFYFVMNISNKRAQLYTCSKRFLFEVNFKMYVREKTFSFHGRSSEFQIRPYHSHTLWWKLTIWAEFLMSKRSRWDSPKLIGWKPWGEFVKIRPVAKCWKWHNIRSRKCSNFDGMHGLAHWQKHTNPHNSCHLLFPEGGALFDDE